MLIFTNEINSEMLNNNDLIELALIILEHGKAIKIEAKLKSAKLASRLMTIEKVRKQFVERNDGASIKGMCDIITKIC